MIKRGMTQKTIIFSAILLVICLLQIGCGKNNTFEGSRISDETGFRMEYSILDKEESAELMLTEGDQIQVSISHTSGNVDVTVGEDGEEPIYKGTGQENAFFSFSKRLSTCCKSATMYDIFTSLRTIDSNIWYFTHGYASFAFISWACASPNTGNSFLA